MSPGLVEEYSNKRFLYFQGDRREMLSYVPRDTRVALDVGCSCGYFGEALKAKLGAEVWGVEPHEPAASVAAERLDRAICAGFDRGLRLPEGYFDCIVFNDVLEHLADPFDALSYCKELLRPGGKVVACIPNVRHFLTLWELVVQKDWQYKEGGVLDRTHLRFFTRRSIRSTFEQSGFRIDRIDGINPCRSRKLVLLNLLLLNWLEDTRFQQFAVVASLDG